LLFSAVAVAGGLLVHGARQRTAAWTTGGRSVFDAQRGYEHVIGGLGRIAVAVTGRLQVGSLPAYLGTILAAVVLLPGVAALVGGVWPQSQELVHTLVQLPLGAAVVVAALAVLRARRRFTAVLLVGVIGYGVGGLFIVDGAPDLALAQFLVETLSLVAFVFVLRRMPSRFTLERQRARTQVPKAVISVAAGGMVAGTAVVLSGARQVPATTSAEFVRLAPEGAGALNVISAIIVDFRALDTVGEITVLFVAAVGVASLVLATPYDRRRRRGKESGAGSPGHEEEVIGDVAGGEPPEESPGTAPVPSEHEEVRP
jgi:multicomponent Na+:H+ antiporter subunit A